MRFFKRGKKSQADNKPGEATMSETKEPVITAVKVDMSDEQKQYFGERAVFAYESLAGIAVMLSQYNIDLLLTTIAIRVPDSDGNKVVVLANPSMPPEVVKEMLEITGRDSELSMNQSQAVIALAARKAEERQRFMENLRDELPDGDEDDDRPAPVKETVH